MPAMMCPECECRWYAMGLSALRCPDCGNEQIMDDDGKDWLDEPNETEQ